MMSLLDLEEELQGGPKYQICEGNQAKEYTTTTAKEYATTT